MHYLGPIRRLQQLTFSENQSLKYIPFLEKMPFHGEKDAIGNALERWTKFR